MDEVAQADFRTDAEREECGGVLPSAEVARVAFLLVEETTAGKHCGEIRGSASGGVPGQRTRRLADRSPAAERPSPLVTYGQRGRRIQRTLRWGRRKATV